MPPMFFGRVLRVDLTESKVEEVRLEDSIYEERIGGAGILSYLLEESNADCVALGVGPLTGTPCPAGSAAIASAPDDKGVLRFAPILLNGGLEFRLSGFDFVTIAGKSPEPSYLWLRDMTADIVSLPNFSPTDCWETCKRIRKEQGDPRIQVISCSEGESASLNFTSGWDGISFGGKMRRMNLMAIAFRGMADIDLHDSARFLDKCVTMMRDFPNSRGGKTGLPAILGDSSKDITGLKRARACFSCPFPCLSYAESGDPSHPQFLLLDQRTFLSHLREGRLSDELVRQIASDHRKGIAKRWEGGTFDTITDGVLESELVTIAYILGLCPRYMGLLNPRIEKYCDLLSAGLGREITKEQLIEMAHRFSRS